MSKVNKQTSSKISSIAARYTKLTAKELYENLATHPMRTVKEIRAMAASLMSQDEIKGQKE